jgi:sterol desaturase/sphingolipid hydroxylase (fatty acid hydroxylase superfamily)
VVEEVRTQALSLGDIKTAISWVLKLARAREQWNKEKDMGAILNTVKHVGFVIISLVGASLVSFLTNDQSLTAELQKGGLSAVYIAITIPAFHVLAVAVQNVLRHISEPK